MLHIRVLSPPGVTGRLLDQLASLPGIENLIVLEGAGHRPDGDAVLLDVRDNAANPVFRMLRDLGLDHDNPIAVELVDASLTDTARQGRKISLRAGEIAPVWEMVGAGGLSTQRAIWRALGARQRIPRLAQPAGRRVTGAARCARRSR